MRELSPGWATDLAVLQHGGSTVEDRDDHLVVRTPHNPDFHWGNCLFVTDEDGLNDAARWVATFRAAFPKAALVTHLWAVSGGCAAGERWAHAAEIEHGKGDECFG